MKLLISSVLALILAGCLDTSPTPSSPTSTAQSEITRDVWWYCSGVPDQCIVVPISVNGALTECTSQCAAAGAANPKCVLVRDFFPCDQP